MVTKPVRAGLMMIAWVNFWQSLTACKGSFIQGSFNAWGTVGRYYVFVWRLKSEW